MCKTVMQKRDVTTDQFRHNNPTQAQLYNLVSTVSVHITHWHEIKDKQLITTKWTRLFREKIKMDLFVGIHRMGKST